MTGVKITEFPNATLPLTGTEIFPIVQSGVTKQTTVNQATSGAARILTNIAALQALNLATTSLPTQVQLTSNYVAGDGGGVFRYDSTDTTSADNGGTIIVDALNRRWKRQFEDGFHRADWFGVLDNSADRTSVLNTAIAASASTTLILPAATIRLDGQVVINVSNIVIQGAGRLATALDLNYTAGPAIEIGDQTSLKREIIFRDVYLQGMAGQDLIRTRWVRGIRFWSVNYVADCFLRLGETTDDLAKATYICELYDVEGAHVASPTKHHVIAANFSGQWVTEGAFIEGAYEPTLDGFHASPNIQPRIDHFIVQGGYWSRFRDNYSFVDARVVNLQIDDSHHCEGAIRNAIRLYTTSATSKVVGNVGWENVNISGKYNGTDNAIYIRGERTGVSCAELSLTDVQIIEATKTPVFILSDDGVIDTILIDNLTVSITPTDANQDVVLISGGNVSSTTISNVTIGQIAGVATSTALRSVVRIAGRVARITPPVSIAVTNAIIGFDDQTSTTPVALTNLTAATTDIINVTDQSESWTRPMTLQNAADYFSTTAATGAFLESEILLAGAVSLTTSTAANVTSITLTPGTWDVNATYGLDPGGGTTSSALAVWINDVSATVPTRPNKGAYVQHAGLPYNVGPVGTRRFTVAVNTPVYLSIFATFAVSTLKAYGYIGARRVYK
jgi:hypothetical protein